MCTMKIDPDNMRILILNDSPFFKFFKPKTLDEKHFLFFEAKRFCWIHLSAEEFTTNQILKEIDGKRRSYFLEDDKLFYAPNSANIGKFLTSKVTHKTRFVWALNWKTNFYCGI